MAKRLIYITIFVVVLLFIYYGLKNHVNKQTEKLKDNALIERDILYNEISKNDLMSHDFILDTTNYRLKTPFIKQLNQIKTIEKANFILFENECFVLNNEYITLKNSLKDSLSTSYFIHLDNIFNRLNISTKAYNTASKKHNVFMGSFPNFYFVKKADRKKLDYFSIRFNEVNLDPKKYKKRFDKYMETGQERFLKIKNN